MTTKRAKSRKKLEIFSVISFQDQGSAMSSSDTATKIINTASSYGIDPRLALEVALQESQLNQAAVSSAGAIGIFQLMPATAAALGVDPHNEDQNIQGGCMLLAQLLAEFGGDVSKALASYDWHPDAVSAAAAKYGADWLSHAPAETQNYVASIEANLNQYTVSVGSPVSSPTPAPGAPVEAGFVSSGMTTGQFLILAGLAFVGLLFLGNLND
jgi:Transglycosylase SLT domain